MVAAVDGQLGGAAFRLLAGIEVDILDDGGLDQTDEMLDRLDVGVASVHSKLAMDARGDDPADGRRRPAPAHQRARALHRPAGARAGGAPARRAVRRRGGVRGVRRARRRGRDQLPARARDPPDELVALALDAGCLFSIDSDAHAPGQLDFLGYGAARAEQLGVPAERIVNTLARRPAARVGEPVTASHGTTRVPAEDAPVVEVRRARNRRRTVAAYRDDDKVVVLVPARFTRAEEQEWVATMLARLERSEKRRRPSDAGLARRAARTQREVPRRPGGAADRAVGRQPEQPVGELYAERPVDPVSTRLQGMPSWVIDYVLVHELAHLMETGHTAAFWRWVDRYPKAERAKGFLEGVAPPPTRHRADPPDCSDEGAAQMAADDAEPLGSASRATSSTPCRGRRSAASCTGHHRTSSDSSLTAGTEPGGATRQEPYVEVAHPAVGAAERHLVRVEVHRLRVEHQVVDAGLLRPSRSAAPASVRSCGSQCPPRWNHRPAFACSVSSTWLRSADSTSAPAVTWSGWQARSSRRGAPRGGRRTPGGAAPGAGRAPRQDRRVASASSCSVLTSSGGPVGAVVRRLPGSPDSLSSSSARAASNSSSRQRLGGGHRALAEAQRVVEVGRGGQQVGVRPDGVAAPRGPGGSAASPTAPRRRAAGAAAARGRRARRTSASAGPPGGPAAAHRLLQLGGRRHPGRRWPGRRPRRPSPRPAPAAVSRRTSAACCAGVFSGSNSPPSRASWMAAGLVGSMPRDLTTRSR